jgi:hypothetical protein
MCKTFEERDVVIREYKDRIAEMFNMRTEGLITDLEAIRAIITDGVVAYDKMNICFKCGAPNEGNHCEDYPGLSCPACTPDKRIFVIIWPDKPAEKRYRWQITRGDDFEYPELEDIDTMKYSETLICRRLLSTVFVTRIS